MPAGSDGAVGEGDPKRAFQRALAERQPHFLAALLADARMTAAMRGEREEFRSRADALLQAVRLMWVSDAFLAHAAYRLKARLQALGVPILPRILHRIAMITGQVSIGDPVLIHPGVYIVHGQIVVDGIVEIHPGAVISPWVTIGLIGPSLVGPTIERDVRIGTGAKVLGDITVGENASIGANAVVIDDVAPGTTVVGVPAKPVERAPELS